MNLFYATLIAVLFMTAVSSIFLLAYHYGIDGKYKWILSDKWYKRIFFTFVCLGLFLCLYLVLQNHFVYYWDYGGYWTTSYNTMNGLFGNPVETVKSVYQSILENDYNYLLPLFISLPLKCFGYTFPRYVLLNYLLFLVPAWIIVVSIVWKSFLVYHPECEKNKNGYICFLFTIFAATTFSPFYYAMLRGYIDVACLIPSLLAILLFMDYDVLSFDRRQVLRDILISSVLLIAFLFRRYFAYFGVGYISALCMYSIFKIVETFGTSGWKRNIRNAILNLFIVCAFAVSVLLIFFRRLVFRILENNYANQYEAYDASFVIKIKGVTAQFGALTFAMVGIALLLALYTRKYRKLTMFCVCSMVVTMAAFFHVQSMGEHHIYTIAGEAFILMILGMYQIFDLIHTKKCKLIAVIATMLVLSIGAMNCFLPGIRPYVTWISVLYAQKYYPMQRNDIEELHHMADFLNNLTDGTDKHVYICASGSVLNSSIMDSLDKPYNSGALHNMYWTADVDLRDGFNADFLNSDYVVVTDPVQLHLKEGTQEVVRFLCEEIQNPDSPLGRHFNKMDQSYLLDNNVTAYIYEKVSEFETSDYQYLADYYDKYYPGMDELFSARIWKAAEY